MHTIHGSNKKLTIGVPTFNRKNRLRDQLEKLVSQDLTDVYEILIVDNASDYSIENLIHDIDCSKIRLVQNKFNIKMSSNMQMPFLHCETDWLWLLSDDDEVLPNSIEAVISGINDTGEKTGMLKFSLLSDKVQTSQTISNLPDFIDYYHRETPIRRGELVFISTNVYNLKVLQPYLGRAFEFSGTYIGFLMPIFFALNDKHANIEFKEQCIVKYLAPEGQNYSFGVVGKGLSILSHLPFDLSSKDRKKFLNITVAITLSCLIKGLIKRSDICTKNELEIICNNVYWYYVPVSHKILYISIVCTPLLSVMQRLYFTLARVKATTKGGLH